MADIDIEKKNAVWPWIVAAAVIIAIILLIVFIDNDSEAVPMAEDESAETITATRAAAAGDNETVNVAEAGSGNLINEDFNAEPVVDYITFINENEDRMGYDHNYTHDALIKLTDAIQALSNEIGHDIEANLSKVTELANEITTDPLSEMHANKITEALRILTNALVELQESYYPTLSEEVSGMEEDVTQLEKIASNVNPDELTTNQKEIINSYFNQAAQVLKLMN